MTANQHTQQANQDDINTRLALISKAVAENLASQKKMAPVAEISAQAQDVLAVSACPIDPMERLLCESCQ